MKVFIIALLLAPWLLLGMDHCSINRSEYEEIPSLPENLERAFRGREELRKAVGLSAIEKAAKKANPERRLFPFKNSDPENLIAYIYYIKLQPNCPELWDEIVYWKIPYPQLVSAQLKGYSVYGAAIVAEKLSRQEKADVIKNLYMLGFKPNQKDYELDRLVAWEAADIDYAHPLLPSEWLK